MQLSHASTRARSVLAGSVAALVAGSALLAAPAGAQSGSLVFICGTVIGDKEFITVADTDLPATLPAGSSVPINVSAKVTIPEDVRNAVYALFNARSVSGAATVKSTVNGSALPDVVATVASTPLPASGPVTVTATGAGPAFSQTAAGTYVLKVASYTAKLDFKKEDGSAAYTADVSCTPKATTPAQDLTVDTVQVTAPTTNPAPVKVDSTTTAKAKYAAKAKKAVVKVLTQGSDGTAGSGKVKVTLKLGKKSKTVRATLNAKGKAKAVFTRITRPGTYKIKVTYAGSDTQNASKAKTTLKVG